MKRVLLATFFSLLLLNCSSDSDKSSSFTSTILIDGVAFVPKQITAYSNDSSVEKSKVFVLQKSVNSSTIIDEMVFRVNYPLTQTSVSGTYLMTGMQGTGTYAKATKNYGFYNGSITIEDLGNNRFQVFFNTVKGTEGNGAAEIITISGSIKGKFQTSN